MTEDLQAAGPYGVDEAPQRRRVWRGPWRSVVFPLLVVAAIAAAIWWMEYRPGSGGTSLYDARYGPVDLPASLVPINADVEAKEGALAPNFLLKTLDGGEVRLSDLRGRPLIVNFWATWCSPCRREMPQFVDAYGRYRDDGLEIIAVNLQESPSIIHPYVDEFGIDFPVALDKRGAVADRYRLIGLPTTLFIDREGVIRSVFFGPFLERLGEVNVRGAIEQGDLAERIGEILE